MSIKITIPNSSSDVLTFGSGNTPTAAQIAGIDSGSSNGQLALYTTASGTSTERVRINASGNVGIGTSAPATQLQIGSASGTGKALRLEATGTTEHSVEFASDASVYGKIGGGKSGSGIGDLRFYTYSGGSLPERMRIDSSGNLLVGTTSNTSFSARLCLSYNSGTTNWAIGPWVTTPTNFYISANAGVQGVYLNGATATSWTAWSDERLKTDLQPIENAVEKVSSLRAVTGVFIGDETNTRKPFLIAQDVLSVLPEAVDTSDSERFGLSYTDVIPLLVAAIKEQQAIITSLTDRITALENK